MALAKSQAKRKAMLNREEVLAALWVLELHRLKDQPDAPRVMDTEVNHAIDVLLEHSHQVLDLVDDIPT